MYIVLNQKFNSNLHHISKWFQISQLVSNANETFVVNLHLPKLRLSIKYNTYWSNSWHRWNNYIFWLVFGYEPIMEVSFKYIINPLNAKLNPICLLLALLGAHHILHINRIRVKETEFCMFNFETFILHTKHVHIKKSQLCTFSATDKISYNFWGSPTAMHNVYLNKRIISIMLGLGQTLVEVGLIN